MYESRFGISGLPFQLSPDPSFYFDSRGHHKALVEVRRALKLHAAVLVVSGDIGAGKTMLVRTLLAEPEVANASVAHIVSTQLDAAELLGAALIGFGMQANAAASDAARSEKLLESLAALQRDGRRALLIIDEAQNLRPEAFHALGELCTQALSRELRLQVCLVGQPELRSIVEMPALLPLKRCITVSCHLGPLELEETGPYIEHRLRLVGWGGNPSFQSGAFHEIHRWTGGVPRRINLLCNRLMLSSFFSGQSYIALQTVVDTARELRGELGDVGSEPSHRATEMSSAPAASEPLPPALSDRFVRPLLCVVAGVADHLKAAALMRALSAHPQLPATMLVRTRNDRSLEVVQGDLAALEHDGRVVDLRADAPEHGLSRSLGASFERVVRRHKPCAVVVFNGSDAALICASVAKEKAIPIVHIGAGLRTAGHDALGPDTRRLTDELADLLYAPDAMASQRLTQEGFEPERVHCAGNLLVDAVHTALGNALDAVVAHWPTNGGQPPVTSQNGYGLVALSQPINVSERQSFAKLLRLLADVSRDLALVWPVHPRVERQIEGHRLENLIAAERIARIALQPYNEFIGLLQRARCVLTDSWSVQEEATALQVPCLTIGNFPDRALTVSLGSNLVIGQNRSLATRAIWECVFSGGKRGGLPPMWDGRSGARIASYMAAWLTP